MISIGLASLWVLWGQPAAAPLPLTTIRSPLRTPAGVVEHEPVVLEGLPVRGAFTTWNERLGSRTRVAQRRVQGAPQFRPAEARVPIDQVEALVAAALQRSSVRLARPPQLVYQVLLGTPVLAWEAEVALQLSPEPSAPIVTLSAMTGRVLAVRDAVTSAEAEVFPENPAETPAAVTVELTGLGDIIDGAQGLTGSRVAVYNCTAAEPESIVAWWDDGDCYPAQVARADEAGNYRVAVPQIIVHEDNVQPEDPFAEVSAYYHAERFLEWMRTLGVGQVTCEQHTILTNYRRLEPTSSALPFEAYNNAFFTHQCDPEVGPTMVFGQGSEVDFAYDGDVVYHELGHGVVATLTPEGLHRGRLRDEAAVVDAGAINEAIADYFAMALTEDGEVGEYVGRFWAANSRPYIRSADNDSRCPDDIIGEVHADGEPVMAALWSARTKIGAGLDHVVLEALTRLADDTSFEEASAVLLDVAAEHASDGRLGNDAVAVLDRALRARNLIDCPRVITDPAAVAAGRTMYLRRKTDNVDAFYPGPMQLRYVVPEGETKAWVIYDHFARGDDEVPTAKVLVKIADAPIAFSYEMVEVEGEDGEKPKEILRVTGDWDLELDPVDLGAAGNLVEIDGLVPGQVLHLTLASTSKFVTVAARVRVVPAQELDVEDDETSDGAAASGDAEGCACNAAATTSAWWLPVLALIRRRRTRARGDAHRSA